jgi:hypothetical protein
MHKLTTLAAAGAGYLLGSKAGRKRYEQIRSAARRVGEDPRVQEKAHQAADLAKEKLSETAHAAKEAAPWRHDDQSSTQRTTVSSPSGAPAPE